MKKLDWLLYLVVFCILMLFALVAINRFLQKDIDDFSSDDFSFNGITIENGSKPEVAIALLGNPASETVSIQSNREELKYLTYHFLDQDNKCWTFTFYYISDKLDWWVGRADGLACDDHFQLKKGTDLKIPEAPIGLTVT